jgi:hypothetical protein
MIMMYLLRTIYAKEEWVLAVIGPDLFLLFLGYFERESMSFVFPCQTMTILDFWHGNGLPTYAFEIPTSP